MDENDLLLRKARRDDKHEQRSRSSSAACSRRSPEDDVLRESPSVDQRVTTTRIRASSSDTPPSTPSDKWSFSASSKKEPDFPSFIRILSRDRLRVVTKTKEIYDAFTGETLGSAAVFFSEKENRLFRYVFHPHTGRRVKVYVKEEEVPHITVPKTLEQPSAQAEARTRKRNGEAQQEQGQHLVNNGNKYKRQEETQTRTSQEKRDSGWVDTRANTRNRNLKEVRKNDAAHKKSTSVFFAEQEQSESDDADGEESFEVHEKCNGRDRRDEVEVDDRDHQLQVEKPPPPRSAPVDHEEVLAAPTFSAASTRACSTVITSTATTHTHSHSLNVNEDEQEYHDQDHASPRPDDVAVPGEADHDDPQEPLYPAAALLHDQPSPEKQPDHAAEPRQLLEQMLMQRDEVEVVVNNFSSGATSAEAHDLHGVGAAEAATATPTPARSRDTAKRQEKKLGEVRTEGADVEEAAHPRENKMITMMNMKAFAPAQKRRRISISTTTPQPQVEVAVPLTPGKAEADNKEEDALVQDRREDPNCGGAGAAVHCVEEGTMKICDTTGQLELVDEDGSAAAERGYAEEAEEVLPLQAEQQIQSRPDKLEENVAPGAAAAAMVVEDEKQAQADCDFMPEEPQGHDKRPFSPPRPPPPAAQRRAEVEPEAAVLKNLNTTTTATTPPVLVRKHIDAFSCGGASFSGSANRARPADGEDDRSVFTFSGDRNATKTALSTEDEVGDSARPRQSVVIIQRENTSRLHTPDDFRGGSLVETSQIALQQQQRNDHHLPAQHQLRPATADASTSTPLGHINREDVLEPQASSSIIGSCSTSTSCVLPSPREAALEREREQLLEELNRLKLQRRAELNLHNDVDGRFQQLLQSKRKLEDRLEKASSAKLCTEKSLLAREEKLRGKEKELERQIEKIERQKAEIEKLRLSEKRLEVKLGSMEGNALAARNRLLEQKVKRMETELRSADMTGPAEKEKKRFADQLRDGSLSRQREQIAGLRLGGGGGGAAGGGGGIGTGTTTTTSSTTPLGGHQKSPAARAPTSSLLRAMQSKSSSPGGGLLQGRGRCGRGGGRGTPGATSNAGAALLKRFG